MLTSTALGEVVAACAEASAWGVVFEYELPLEGGRRADVVVLTGAEVIVLEFKSSRVVTQADADQAAAYARDLSEYHLASRNLACDAVVVATHAPLAEPSPLGFIAAAALAAFLLEREAGSPPNVAAWIDSQYSPLPTLVDAARRMFKQETLPQIFRAKAAGLDETVDLVVSLVKEAHAQSERRLVLVTGVPGAGKTLVGLRAVYEHSDELGQATFLSGNGPLVRVLQDALGSEVFVRDLHSFLRTYAERGQPPLEHVLVFDEAQRAWDTAQMTRKRKIGKSEPELLIEIGDRIEDWAVLVGLVGEGQSIHTGEEGGIAQWRDAITTAKEAWSVYGPPKLASEFGGLRYVGEERLDLKVSIRSQTAQDLHAWVAAVLDGRLDDAGRIAAAVVSDSYPVWITRNLGTAVAHLRRRYSEEPTKRYGLLASSRANSLLALGSTTATRRPQDRWTTPSGFNAPPDDPQSCCQLTQPLTEFGCQGLELDKQIVCWGDDLRWERKRWHLGSRGPRDVQDPMALRLNAYRVLLTRGRDGMVIFVPATRDLDKTFQALLHADAAELPLTALSRATPGYFEFYGSRDLKRLLLTTLAFRNLSGALPLTAEVAPASLQALVTNAPSEAFAGITEALSVTTYHGAKLTVFGAAGARLTYDDYCQRTELAAIDSDDPNYVEIARWLGLPERNQAAENLAGSLPTDNGRAKPSREQAP
jgi:Schlafen group 3, DNA/RNA helicase domain